MLMETGATFVDSDVHLLMDTIKSGSLEEVKEILDYGMDPNWHTSSQAAIVVSDGLSSVFQAGKPVFWPQIRMYWLGGTQQTSC